MVEPTQLKNISYCSFKLDHVSRSIGVKVKNMFEYHHLLLMEEIRLTSWYVVYPLFKMFIYPRWLFGISSINSRCAHKIQSNSQPGTVSDPLQTVVTRVLFWFAAPELPLMLLFFIHSSNYKLATIITITLFTSPDAHHQSSLETAPCVPLSLQRLTVYGQQNAALGFWDMVTNQPFQNSTTL